MNKEILNQLPSDEQPIASKLQAVAEDMQLSPTFEWELEKRLMEKHASQTRPARGWFARIAPTLGWAFATVCVLFLLNWAISSLVPGLPATSNTSQPTISPTYSPSNTQQPSHTPTPVFTAIPGQIAFVSDESGHDQIYLMNSDGSEIHRLTTDDSDDRDPTWSPDGTRIAFTQLIGAHEEMIDGENVLRAVESAEIIIMEADGSKPVSLTHNLSEQGFAALHPTWSADGKYIAFEAAKIDKVGNAPTGWNIYVATVSGSGDLRQVTGLAGEITAGCINPQWLPDSKRILANCQSSSNEPSIVLFNMEDGSNIRILEPMSNVGGHPDNLSYQVSRSGVVAVGKEMIITTLKGTDFLNKISFEKGWLWVQEVAWSPISADQLAVRAMDGVFVINEDGSQLNKIASFGNYQDPAPSLSWSPDGSQIVFATMQDYQKNILDGNQEIMIAALDHTSMMRLTFTDANESQPAWRPFITLESSTQEESFEEDVRQGNICTGPLAVGHDFAVSLTNQDKTGFVTVDPQNVATELRSFAWSPDGSRLAAAGLTEGLGNIYLTDSGGAQLQPLFDDDLLGTYPNGVTWTRDGKRLLMWSISDTREVYLSDVDGTVPFKFVLPDIVHTQTLSTPQFAPNDESIVFYGGTTTAGLFEVSLKDLEARPATNGQSSPEAKVYTYKVRVISALVEDKSGFAFSPDGSRLAYIEMDRNSGEARLVSEEFATQIKTVLATLPIPKGSGSSIPESANLSWSPDGQFLVFDFGSGVSDRAVYLAYANSFGLVKLADAAHAPTISADGNCLAYISKKQVFLIDLNSVSSESPTAAPMLLADLPKGKSSTSGDQLQWAPGKISTTASSFEEDVRAGKICAGPLALAYNLSVALTNQDKSGYIILDEQKTIGELRDFAWSADGTHLAVAGRSNIYLTDSQGAPLQPIFTDSERPGLYLNGVTWSPNGKQLILQTIENFWAYLTNTAGAPAVRIQPSKYVLSKPQFTPDNTSIIYYGADSDSSGLFETMLDGSQTRLISPLVESNGWSGFGLSPDGSRLAYIEIDRNQDQDTREARLILEKLATGEKSTLGKFPIPHGTGSKIPESSNMSWSADGKIVTFELRLFSGDRAVYLAYADGTGMVKLADWGHAPTMSTDGNCLAYISDKQLFVLDLSQVSLNSPAPAPVRLAELPAGAAYIEKLQWRP